MLCDVQIHALPELISYSPLHISEAFPSSGSCILAKRDLYDARFQLIASGTSGNDSVTLGPDSDGRQSEQDLQFVEAPSDLVPGLYEGGLKTWECSIDLAGYIRTSLNDVITRAKSLRALEVCMSSLSAYILSDCNQCIIYVCSLDAVQQFPR